MSSKTYDRDQIIAWETDHESGTYGKQPIVLVRGEGAHIWDMDGTEYIDCIGGHGASNMGHAHPAVVKAVTEQAQRLFLAPNGFYNDVRAQLLAELARVAPPGLERAFLCNSGTEAVEAALKFARLTTQRTKVISTMRGFHGRTMGALGTTWRKEYRRPFEPLLPNFNFVPYNRLERMEKAIDDETSAVIVEVVQGEGGVNLGSADYLLGVQALCRERGAMFIVDEVQTGFGRTGKLFAGEHYGLRPDLMTVAKSIAGGIPMGATLIGDRVGKIPGHVHGSTFGGSPLACAAALATIRTMKEDHLPERAAKLGARLMEGFRSIDASVVREVRGLGLMVGIELRGRSGAFLAALAAQGVLALPAGSTVLRFLPPLVIEEDDIEMVIEKVGMVLAG
jgi:LysW-gamma-L-lysine/LysW-L-ornithine aminotransferase